MEKYRKYDCDWFDQERVAPRKKASTAGSIRHSKIYLTGFSKLN